MKKICHRCQTEKPLDDFYNQANAKDGRDGYCKACRKEYNVAYRSGRLDEEAARRRDGRRRKKEGRPPKTKTPLYRHAARILRNTRSNVRAKQQRGEEIACEVTHGDIEALWEAQRGMDYYTGLPMLLGDEQRGHDSPSLDRIDSAEGYVAGNICLCCWWINRAKGRMSEGEFLRRLRAVHV